MKHDKTLFLSMEVEIMKMSILIDEVLITRIESAAIKDPDSSDTGAAATTEMGFWDTEEATVSLHCGGTSSFSVMKEELEKFKRVFLQIKDFLDAETTVEKWVIDFLRLGQIKGFIYKDKQVPRVETSAVTTWWRQLRLVLDDVRDVFDEISIDVTTIIGLRERLHDVISLKPRDPRRIDYGSNMDGSNKVFGRQEDAKRIIKLLVSNIDIIEFGTTTSSVDAHIIPIVGDAGIGKTTLAKQVYNADKVDSHFDWKMWVNLSNQSLGILGVTVTENGVSDKHFTFSKIRKSLHGKKFLLVLDEVSNEICCDWVALQVLLMAGASGSRILITTRSFSSSTLGTVPPYRLQPLSDEDCWELFIYRASRDNCAIRPPFRCYQDTVKWFQGFPSLVVALEGFSHSKPNAREIEAIQYNNNNKALSLISSSMLRTYHGLSSMHIKQCLLYCALFPKAYEFQKRKLIWQWMAEGFLQPKSGLTVEEVGFKYFEELAQTSFFQLRYESEDHTKSSYLIPDGVHNFVGYMSGNEYFRIDNKETYLPGDARHVSVCCRGAFDHFFNGLHRLKSLQTLLFIVKLELRSVDSVYPIKMLPPRFFLHLTSLRVLDLGYTGLLALPGSISDINHLIGSEGFNFTWLLEMRGSISDLKHLRFLDLSGNDLRYLPEKMSMCHNLETLIMTKSSKLERFPRDMGKLINLRHLILGYNVQKFVMPPGIGNLTNLQTLRLFTIGTRSDGVGRLEDLRELVHLRGSLLILELNDVPQENAWQGGWLADKAYLQQLDLFWGYDMPGHPETSENLLAGLQPHTNLVHLKIRFYGGLKFPFWLGDPTFSNLETIELCNSRTCESLPPLGQLPFLKSLMVHSMDALKYIGDGFLGKSAKGNRFPSLRTLKLKELSCLEKWSGLGEGDMHLLEQLEVSGCEILTSFPTLQFLGCLKLLRITRCPIVEPLPEKKLPSSLESLVIMSCPSLEEKFEKPGKEWRKKKKTKLRILKR